MSEYLNQPLRTKDEALADIRKKQAKLFLGLINRVSKLCEDLKDSTKKD